MRSRTLRGLNCKIVAATKTEKFATGDFEMNENQTASSLALIGTLAGGIGIVAFVAMMVIGSYGFSAAFVLALIIATVVSIVLYRGFLGAGNTSSHEPLAASARAESHASAPAMGTSGVESAAPEAAQSPNGDSEPPSDGNRPSLYAAAPTDPDDLKLLNGVGPGLENTLNELGIYKFSQVASWGPDEIAWVDTKLKFKGRIERDNWVAQAKTLAEGGTT